MSLRDYKNFSDILLLNKPSTGLRFSNNELQLLSPIKFKANLNLNPESGYTDLSKQKFEFHLYGLGGEYIAGNQSSTYIKKIDDEFLYLDLKEDINKLQYRGGVFRFVYNFVYDLVGSYNTDKLFISEISPSRTELKLKLQSPENQESITELEDLFRLFLDEKVFYLNLVLNFGQNKIIPVGNIASDGTATSLYIKLFDPLPEDIQEQTLLWVSREIIPPYVDSVQIESGFSNVNVNTIRGPKTDLEDLYWDSYESNYKSWTDLLTSTSTVSDKVENYFKSLRFGTDLNIDFTKFENFVYYGSAKERVENFFYKINLLEYYNSLLVKLEPNSINHTTEILGYTKAINSIIQSFDLFERYLYYDDDDRFVKTQDQVQSIFYSIPPYPKYTQVALDFTWIEWAQLWVGANVVWEQPGTAGTLKVLRATNSDDAILWYQEIINRAIEYDSLNESKLLNTVPEHILLDPLNDAYTLFVNMIGHYYDNIWVYVQYFNKKYSQNENPYLGKPPDLLPTIAKEYNWVLSNSYKGKDLWEYFFNLTEVDQLKTYNNSMSSNTLTPGDSTKHVWSRIVNNLPYLLKTKGNSRSIKALFATFGIPEALIRIKEYGGPGLLRDGVARTILRKDYPFLKLNNNYLIEIPWDAKENSYSIKWSSEWSGSNLLWSKFNDTASINCIYLNILPTQLENNSYMNIFSIGNNSEIAVTAYQSSSLYSSLILTLSGSNGIISASASAENIFDGTPTVLVLQTDGYYTSSQNNIQYTLYASQEKYNKIVLFESCSISITGSLTGSYNSNWFTESKITVGSFSSSITSNYFTGSINEIRFWKKPLKEKIIKSHTLSYRSYNDDTVSGSYENLLLRIPFWVSSSIYNTNFLSITTNKLLTQSLGNSVIPSASYHILDSYISPETATIGIEAINPTKERIESATLLSSLEVDRRREISSYDLYSNDDNKLKIGFSPQFNIDDDIQDQFGSFELDSYIDPSDSYFKYYPNLSELSKFYSKTQIDENPIIKYLRLLEKYDFSIFEQIKQIIPARTNTILGIIIENSILQRIRIKFTPDVTVTTTSNQSITVDNNPKTQKLKIDRLNASILDLDDEVSINQNEVLPLDISTETKNPPVNMLITTAVINGADVNNIKLEEINSHPIDLYTTSSIQASIKQTGTDLNAGPSIAGEYSKQSVVLKTTPKSTKQFSKYLAYPTTAIKSLVGFTSSFNNNFNYEISIDLTETSYLNTNILNSRNYDFYKKISYHYSTRENYENDEFYSSSIVPTEIGSYPYGKSKGMQNSTFIGTRNSALNVNQISSQPGISNYSPVFEITGSQLEPVFSYEFEEVSGSAVVYQQIVPIIPTQTS